MATLPCKDGKIVLLTLQHCHAKMEKSADGDATLPMKYQL
jgi:hypothetical protein